MNLTRNVSSRLTAMAVLIASCLYASLSAADITHSQAHVALEAALKKAQEQGTKMNIAVVDAGANLKAFTRMDGSYLGSIDVSIKKAKTARFFDAPTGELGKITQPGGAIFNIELTNGGLVTFPGGVPLKDKDGNVIGAIGISGGTIDDDHEVAMAAAKALLK